MVSVTPPIHQGAVKPHEEARQEYRREGTFAVFALVVYGEVQQRQQVVIVQENLMSRLLKRHIYI